MRRILQVNSQTTTHPSPALQNISTPQKLTPRPRNDLCGSTGILPTRGLKTNGSSPEQDRDAGPSLVPPQLLYIGPSKKHSLWDLAGATAPEEDAGTSDESLTTEDTQDSSSQRSSKVPSHLQRFRRISRNPPPLPGIHRLCFAGPTQRPYYSIPPVKSSGNNQPLRRQWISTPGLFTRLRGIQAGSHGKTEVVREEGSGRIMCVKIFTKPYNRSALESELDAYVALSHFARKRGENWAPYVMRMDASLEDSERVYFLMDLMHCDLGLALKQWNRGLIDTHKRRWIAQIETIHDAGILHRDLKPQNILVDFRYNVRISDFGCSWINTEGKPLHRFGEYDDEVCGTWPYTAPEVMENSGKPEKSWKKFGLAVDYWALGCIVFELEQEGSGPLFDQPSELDAFTRYRPVAHQGVSWFAFANMDSAAESLVTGLLRPRPAHRYSYAEVRCHRYFRNHDGPNQFDDIEQKARVLNNLPTGVDIPRNLFKREGASATTYSPSLHNTALYREDNSWINPRGIWGSENPEISCYYH